MRYQILTEIDGHAICVECDERTAWVLQPLWAKQYPNKTECRLILDPGTPDLRFCPAPWADPAEVKRYLGPRQ